MSSIVETATEIRPFQIDIPEGKIDDLRRRIDATNWLEKETVVDQSQGVRDQASVAADSAAPDGA
jgi:hypothetical protein